MADPSTYRPAPGTVPESPGVYKFRDSHGRVIYVGKAKNLRARLSSYFADLAGLHPRTRQMVTSAANVEWTVVTTEVEALQLEYNWIKEFDPRFNVRYRDDKSYPVLAVTLAEQYPRLHVSRGRRRKGVRYFGPYAHAWAIRETLDLLLRVFPARTCSPAVFKRHGQIGRPCLLGYIDKCSAPCVGRVDAEEHREIVNDFCDFLAGKTDALIRELERKMQAASEEFDFERAARLRDDIAALRKAMEKQAVVLGDGTDADVIAFAQDELEAAVQIFHVRGGRVRGQRGWVIDKVEETETAGLVGQFLSQFYGEQAALAEQADAGGSPVPREVLVPELPGDATALSEWLSRLRGSRVNLRVPRRGDKRALAGTVERNASEAFAQHKLRRAGDLTARSAALQELADQLGLEAAPLRIECVDVSHVQGSDVVAALVVFEDGMPRKSEYRRFAIREGAAGGDVGSIEEVTRRRFTNYLTGDAGGGSIDRAGEGGAPRARNRPGGTGDAGGGSIDRAGEGGAPRARNRPGDTGDAGGGSIDRAGEGGAPRARNRPGGTESSAAHQPGIDPETGKAKKFAYPPNLYVVDGGAPQVEAAHDVLTGLGVTDVAVIGLAKRLEEVWVPAEIDPLVLPRASEALYLLQRVRDEAHRFAITYHRAKRGKRMSRSALDDVPGLGQTRKTALLKHFGSLRKIRDADLEQLTAVPGVGRSTAEALQAALAPEPAGQPGRDADDQAHCTEPESTSGETEETSG